MTSYSYPYLLYMAPYRLRVIALPLLCSVAGLAVSPFIVEAITPMGLAVGIERGNGS
jgi:hypothetical protein